jgi:hypothetical protein
MAIFLSQGSGKSEEHGTGERLFSLVICKRSEPLFKQIGAVQTSIQVVQFIVQNLQHCNSLDMSFHPVEQGMSGDESLAQIARWREAQPRDRCAVDPRACGNRQVPADPVSATCAHTPHPTVDTLFSARQTGR